MCENNNKASWKRIFPLLNKREIELLINGEFEIDCPQIKLIYLSF